MKIGELSSRTGVSRRRLRYYEDQGVLASDRAENGYREYDHRAVERVVQVRGLLKSGLPVRIIRQILPCLDVPGILVCQSKATPEIVDAIAAEHDRISARIESLEQSREAVALYLIAVRRSRSG